MPVSRCGTQIEFNFQPHAAARAHLASRAGEAGGAHVLNADDRAGLHGFEAGFEQQFLHKWIAHLHVRPLLLGAFLEFLAGHGGAVDAVAARLGAYIDDRIARRRRPWRRKSRLCAPGPAQTH